MEGATFVLTASNCSNNVWATWDNLLTIARDKTEDEGFVLHGRVGVTFHFLSTTHKFCQENVYYTDWVSVKWKKFLMNLFFQTEPIEED